MNLDNLKLIGLNIKDYFVDLALLAVIGLFTSLIISILIVITPIHYNFPLLGPLSNYDLFPLSLGIIKVSVWLISFLIVRWLMGKQVVTYLSGRINNKYFFDANRKNKELSEVRFLKEWIFQGNVLPTDDGLLVSNSNSGCLVKPKWFISRVWKNFTADIEVDFPQQLENFDAKFGVIFRAQNFDDYLMLEFELKGPVLILRPHIRSKGDWDPIINNIDRNKALIFQFPFQLKIEAEENVVKVYVNKNQDPLRWIVPTHVEALLRQRAEEKDRTSKTSIPELYFRNRAGMFGFRCYGNQIVLIKSLDIR